MTPEKQNSTTERRGSRAHKGFENLIAHPLLAFAFSLVVGDECMGRPVAICPPSGEGHQIEV
jgi:hypothetical protein